MSGQIYTPATLPPGNAFPVGTEERAGYVAKSALEALENRRISRLCLEDRSKENTKNGDSISKYPLEGKHSVPR